MKREKKIISQTRIFIFALVALLFSFLIILEAVNFPEYFSEPVATKAKTEIEKSFSIFIVGDMMLDRSVKIRIDKEGIDYPFRDIKEYIKEVDLAVANLEGVFSNSESIALRDHRILRFTFAPSLAATLFETGFDFLSQANNHANDFGKEGETESKDILNKNKISTFGNYFNTNNFALYNDKEQKLAFVGFNEFSYENFELVLDDIRSLVLQDYKVFVMPHYGVEYERFPSSLQKEWSHKFIDGGASGVFGAHPHVVQTIEIYKGKPIFYSLGNFIFDQDFSEETTEGLALKLILKDKKMDIELLPLSIPYSKPELKVGKEKEEMLLWLSDNFEGSIEEKEEIRLGNISNINF